MRVEWQVAGEIWTLQIERDAEDPIEGQGQGTMTVGLLSNKARFIFPREIRHPHPDLKALAALVAVRPWIKERLIVEDGVSAIFAETARKLFKIEVGPVDAGLLPRTPGSRPVLSYSGGVDSIAASLVMPSDTPHVHYRRIDHPDIPDRAPHVRADGIEDVVLETQRRGRHVEICYSDLEHLCAPYPTLPHWFAITIGALLMADELDSGAIAMGGTLETFYMDMGRRWRGEGGKGLEPLAEAVGLPFMRPMLGVTEIGTMKLCLSSDLADIARSCVLGSREQACGRCAKCVRKTLTAVALSDAEELPQQLATLPQDAPGIKSLSGNPPYYMQAQLEFALARVKPQSGPLAELYERLGFPAAGITDWMSGHYTAALDRAVPAQWRDLVRTELDKHLSRMSDQHLADAKAWTR